MVLVPTKNATKNHLAIVEGVQPTNSKLGGLKLPNAIREPVKYYLTNFSVRNFKTRKNIIEESYFLGILSLGTSKQQQKPLV